MLLRSKGLGQPTFLHFLSNAPRTLLTILHPLGCSFVPCPWTVWYVFHSSFSDLHFYFINSSKVLFTTKPPNLTMKN